MDIEKRRVNGFELFCRRFLGSIWFVIATPLYSFGSTITWFLDRKYSRFFQAIWAKQLLLCVGAKIVVHGLENIDPKKRYVFVCNHQSHLDIPSLFVGMPYHLTFMAKKELFMIPFFGWGMKVVGHISVDRQSARKARESFSLAVERLKVEDICSLIFPEGTRSSTGELGEFKRASFTLALESGLAIVPLALVGTRTLLPKHSLSFSPGIIHIMVGKPIEVTNLDMSAKEELAKNVRTTIQTMLSHAPNQSLT